MKHMRCSGLSCRCGIFQSFERCIIVARLIERLPVKQPVLLLYRRLVVLELVKFLVLADIMEHHLRVNARCAPSLSDADHTGNVGCDVVVMVHDLNLEALVMVRLLSALGSIFYAQDIFLVNVHIFLLVHYIFDNISMAKVSLVKRRLKV